MNVAFVWVTRTRSRDSHVSDLSSEGRQGGQACYHLNHLGLWEEGCSSKQTTSSNKDKARGAHIAVHLDRCYDKINV